MLFLLLSALLLFLLLFALLLFLLLSILPLSPIHSLIISPNYLATLVLPMTIFQSPLLPPPNQLMLACPILTLYTTHSTLANLK